MTEKTCNGVDTNMGTFSNVDDCKAECLKRSTCKAVVYKPAKGFCHYYASLVVRLFLDDIIFTILSIQ